MIDGELQKELDDLRVEYLRNAEPIIKGQQYEIAAILRDQYKRDCDVIIRIASLNELEYELYNFELKMYLEQNKFD